MWERRPLLRWLVAAGEEQPQEVAVAAVAVGLPVVALLGGGND
eukprot:COSAG05_NODE_24032_length_254_cov_0.670968_1_plen_42_part_10